MASRALQVKSLFYLRVMIKVLLKTVLLVLNISGTKFLVLNLSGTKLVPVSTVRSLATDICCPFQDASSTSFRLPFEHLKTPHYIDSLGDLNNSSVLFRSTSWQDG